MARKGDRRQARREVWFALFLVLFGGGAPSIAAQASPPQLVVDRVAGVVNGEVITLSDLRWLIYYRGLRVPAEEGERNNFLESVLQQVIDQKLIAAEAVQTPGIFVSQREVDDRLEAYRKTFPSESDFENHLSRVDMTEKDLRNLIQRQLAVLEFVRIRFDPFIIILPDRIREYYENELVAQLAESGQPVPPLSLVEEQIREILTVERVNVEMDNWVQSARRKAQIDILLFSDETLTSNLPGEYWVSRELESVLPGQKPN